MARRSSLGAWPAPASTLSTSRFVKAAYRPPRSPISGSRPPYVAASMAAARRLVKRACLQWRKDFPCRTLRAAMSVLALVLAAQIALRGDTVPPYLAFPEAGLDDPP